MNLAPFPAATRQPITPAASPTPRLSDCAEIILASKPEIGRHFTREAVAEHVAKLAYRLEVVGRIEEAQKND